MRRGSWKGGEAVGEGYGMLTSGGGLRPPPSINLFPLGLSLLRDPENIPAALFVR